MASSDEDKGKCLICRIEDGCTIFNPEHVLQTNLSFIEIMEREEIETFFIGNVNNNQTVRSQTIQALSCANQAGTESFDSEKKAGNLTSLIDLVISNSKYEKFNIFEKLQYFTNLTSLTLNNVFDETNPSSVQIDEEMSKLNKLIRLSLEGNNFVKIDVDLSLLTQLTFLRLRGNDFGTTIPQELTALTSLRGLTLADSNFFGTIPELSIFDKLNIFDVGGNHFTGLLPTPVIDLAHLNLSFNQFEDNLDTLEQELAGVGDFPPGLKTLMLSNNKFFGNIPSNFGTMSELLTVDLSNNVFNGNIPASMGSLKLVETLRLNNNNLTGIIPSSFNQLTSLKELKLLGTNRLNITKENFPVFLYEIPDNDYISTTSPETSISSSPTISNKEKPAYTKPPVFINEVESSLSFSDPLFITLCVFCCFLLVSFFGIIYFRPKKLFAFDKPEQIGSESSSPNLGPSNSFNIPRFSSSNLHEHKSESSVPKSKAYSSQGQTLEQT